MRSPIGLGVEVARLVSGAAADAAGRTALAGLDALLGWRYTEEAVAHTLRAPLVDAVARDVARYAVVDRLTERLLSGPELDRLVDQVLESRLPDTIVERLLESEDLWLLVEEIARSPAVMEAIGHQGAGFADQVAQEVRVRTQHADAGLERVARRLLRRAPAP